MHASFFCLCVFVLSLLELALCATFEILGRYAGIAFSSVVCICVRSFIACAQTSKYQLKSKVDE